MIYSVDAYPGRSVSVNGKSYLYFGGTSYLGLQTDEAFKELFVKNLKRYGTNYGASRKANVQISIFDEVEAYLSILTTSQSCTTLSSGYLAGQLVAQTLNTNDHELFYAPESHAALQIAPKQPYANYNDLEQAVRAHLKRNKSIPVVFIDSIDVLGSGYPDFTAIRRLPLEDVILVVDDSHGIGVVGNKGAGSYTRAKQLNARELIVCCSLGKGFGIQAGAILGTKKRIQQFTNTDFFGGASPASPAALATLVQGETIFDEKRILLQSNVRLFLDSLKNPKRLHYLDTYPAFYFSDSQIASFLEKNNVLITNFNYPNTASPLMNRIVISAAHEKEDILYLAELLNLH
ncbi:MAG: aminotransferase class I/II-fold pyridoxal phosphate-dependent enzyme [Maribacter sp.]|uniref:aminotransferase class I/II-fold pyridoxal phosphate-dependent enzyme n=1 Tax=Maribacter sp. TaxID=1897614 RepID=UPI00329772D1